MQPEPEAKGNVAEPAREVDKKVEDWAEPILGHVDERESRRRYLKVAAVGVAVGLAVVWPVSVVYLHLGWLFPYLVFGICAFGIALFSAEYLVNRLSPAEVTLPQAYSIHILRMLRRSSDPGPKFEDSVVKFVRRIDVDLNELQGNLAASRTVKILRQLRVLVLKFATAVKQNREGPIKSMRGTFGTVASMFYRFEDVEGLDAFLVPELHNVSSLPEGTYLISPVRPYVNFLRKWPATMTALFVSFGIMAYVAYFVFGNPFYAILVGFGLTILLGFRKNIGCWVRERWGE